MQTQRSKTIPNWNGFLDTQRLCARRRQATANRAKRKSQPGNAFTQGGGKAGIAGPSGARRCGAWERGATGRAAHSAILPVFFSIRVALRRHACVAAKSIRDAPIQFGEVARAPNRSDEGNQPETDHCTCNDEEGQRAHAAAPCFATGAASGRSIPSGHGVSAGQYLLNHCIARSKDRVLRSFPDATPSRRSPPPKMIVDTRDLLRPAAAQYASATAINCEVSGTALVIMGRDRCAISSASSSQIQRTICAPRCAKFDANDATN